MAGMGRREVSMNQRLFSMMVLCCVAGSVMAQPEADKPAEDVLSGPKVKETQSERTLVKRDFSGKVQRLDANPAEAAVELLTLDEATRAKVKAVVDERTAAMDRIVRDNLELLVKFQNTGDRKGKMALLREYREVFKEIESKGKLQDQVKAVLPKEQAARYDELIAGYWDTVVADAQQEAKKNKETAGRGEILAREGLVAFGGEIRRSYERQIGAKTKELEEFLGKLGLTPEKETKIRNMFTDSFQATVGKPTAQQRRDLMMKVLRELDAEQRKIVIEELLGKEHGTSENMKPAPMVESDEPMMPKSEEPK
jgi:hypothetical protein